jgi:hypothetical protein
VHAHCPRHAAPRLLRRDDIAAIGDVGAAALVVGAQVIGAGYPLA